MSAHAPSGPRSWLGVVPSTWNPRPLWTLLERNDGGVWGDDGDERDTVVLRSTELRLDGSWTIEDPAYRRLTETERAKALLVEGDLLVTKSSGSPEHLGKTGIVSGDVARLRPAYSNFMQRLRVTRDACPRYTFWLINGAFGRDTLNYLGSTTTGLRNLTAGVLGRILFPGPPLQDQRRIADFLDRKTAAIDALIAKKERQVALIAEKRAATVTELVTRGVHRDVPLKESGIECVGRVPHHWSVLNLRRRWRVIDCKHKTPDYVVEGFPLVSTTEVKPGRLDLTRTKRFVASEDFADMTEGRMPRRGDIIYSRNASLGAAAYVDTDESFCMGQDVVLITSGSQNQLFLAYQLNSSVVSTQIERDSIGSTFKRINVEEILGLKVVVPPLDEQRTIANALDDRTAALDRAADVTTESIRSLREYRQTLITAAVTGQFDVVTQSQEAA